MKQILGQQRTQWLSQQAAQAAQAAAYCGFVSMVLWLGCSAPSVPVHTAAVKNGKDILSQKPVSKKPVSKKPKSQKEMSWGRVARRVWPSDAVGLSGLSIGPASMGDANTGMRMLWAVAEAGDVVWQVSLKDAQQGDTALSLAARKVALKGVPKGLDTEALAFLGVDRLAIATESMTPGRTQDAILIFEQDPSAQNGASLLKVDEIAFPYAPFQLKAPPNQGLEALAACGDSLWAAAEVTGRFGKTTSKAGSAKTQRFAPLGRYDVHQKRWSFYRLALTSAQGKIAALACGPGKSAQLWAIERHFGVSRLLQIGWPHAGSKAAATAEPMRIDPQTAIDLNPHPTTPSTHPNLEGLVALGGRRFVLVSDNRYGGVKGDAQLWVIRLGG